MKPIVTVALALTSLVMAGCPIGSIVDRGGVVTSHSLVLQDLTHGASATTAVAGDALTLGSLPVSAAISKGDPFVVTLTGTASSSVYLQVSDSAALFAIPGPSRPSKVLRYSIGVSLPTSTSEGSYTGSLTVSACADPACSTIHAQQSIPYSVKVNKVDEWETLQRTSRHDGYVPISIDIARYGFAWSYKSATYDLSGVVTDGSNAYFSEPGSSSVYAKRAADGVTQWQQVFSGIYGPAVNPPTVTDGIVYVSTTSQEDTWIHAIRASDGMQLYQSQFLTQWAHILNPTVRNGKVYVNAGYYAGVVYAFNTVDGSQSWDKAGGTYGMNTPAVDDAFVYCISGDTLAVLNATDGSLNTLIGPNPNGDGDDYNGTPMLGSADHVLAYSGLSWYPDGQRNLMDYSVTNAGMRWMSNSLYGNFPADAKGVVYATSNVSHSLDALDESTGRILWSWRPLTEPFNFIGNVVVTDNVVFVSTTKRVYAVDLRHGRHHAVWSAPTPGTMSISADRILFVSTPADSYPYPDDKAHITAYRYY